MGADPGGRYYGLYCCGSPLTLLSRTPLADPLASCLSGNQVIAGHRELAPLLGTAQRCWLCDKPCRIVAGITGSWSTVCRTGGHGADCVTGVFALEPVAV